MSAEFKEYTGWQNTVSAIQPKRIHQSNGATDSIEANQPARLMPMESMPINRASIWKPLMIRTPTKRMAESQQDLCLLT